MDKILAMEVSPSLKIQIEKRIEEAQQKRISEKAQLIASTLGDPTIFRIEDFYGDEYTFTNECLKVQSSNGNWKERRGNCTIPFYYRRIYYNNSLVFHNDEGNFCSYIPGEWEVEFNELVKQAEAKRPEVDIREADRRAREQHEIDERERRKWGL